MDRAILKTSLIILASLGLAFLFNFLFFEKQIGISVLIFNIILLATVFLLESRRRTQFKKTWWLVLAILFFTLMVGIRANELLTFLNVCAAFGLLVLLANELIGIPAPLMKLRDYLIFVFLAPLRMLGRALSIISLIGQIRSTVKHRDIWVRAIKGAIMAVPILIIFAILFSQADLVFSSFVNNFFNINISERAAQYIVLLLFAFVASLSFLSYIFVQKQTQPALAREKSGVSAQSGREIEMMVFLGLISVLFLVFIVFQITYLFGGEANIAKAGFTYAQYARRGFWELLAVAMLSLATLFASQKYAGIESKKEKRFLIPALILIAEVAIIIVSAFKRLSLYIDAYGMTEQRFYAAGFIMLLSVLFILLAIKFIKTKKENFFTFGALLSIMAFVAAVNIMNPDAFIAKYNIEQYDRTDKIDVIYMGYYLSTDAENWKIELYKKLQGEDKNALRELLQKQKDYLQKNSGNWQSTNFSRGRALKLLQEAEL